MTELQLSAEWRKALQKSMARKKKTCVTYRLETGATAVGVPDCYIVLDDECVWVELKKLQPDGTVAFRPGQRLFAMVVNQHGAKAYCVALTDEKTCALVNFDTAQPIGEFVAFKESWRLICRN